MPQTSLFIFRRDLRLVDNTALINALTESIQVIPVFIFAVDQVSNANTHASKNAIQFMIESLYDLQASIQKRSKHATLWVDYGNEIDVIAEIIQHTGADRIYINKDYTPYAQKRDNAICEWCHAQNVGFMASTDLLLVGDAQVVNLKGEPYRVFGFFHKNASKIPVAKVNKSAANNFAKPDAVYRRHSLDAAVRMMRRKKYYVLNENIAVNGGRKNGLRLLKRFDYTQYLKSRENPNACTSHTSAHNKFGTISIREVYHNFQSKQATAAIDGLYWRDFYYYMAINFDNFFDYQHMFIEPKQGSHLWVTGKLCQTRLDAWCNAQTGFPIVDAAMRELNATGYIHNRSRLIVSEFLVKDLHINWQAGEQYFTKHLVDIDRCQNMGNWNWSASAGLDATPFLRIFNPWSQSAKFDKKAKYIKKWIPELEHIPAPHLHKWDQYCQDYDTDYPNPILDHKTQRVLFIKNYQDTHK